MSNTPTPDLDRDALESTLERINQEAIVSVLQSFRPTTNPTTWTIVDQVTDIALSNAILAVRNRSLPPAKTREPVAHARNGWKLVPREPTEAMKQAAFGPVQHGGRGGPATADFIRQEASLSVYRKIWDTAPTPPSTSSGDGELSKGAQEDALNFAINTSTPGQICSEAPFVLDALHAAGYRIVRTAPSGEQDK